MRAGIVVNVTRAYHRRLEAIVADRSAPQKHAWRAKIVMATADGCGTVEIMRRSGKAKPVVWTWQARFMAEGVGALPALQDTQAWQAHNCRPTPCSRWSTWRWGRHLGKQPTEPAGFASLNVLECTVIRRNTHRHQKFIRFLNAV
jgi:hypothetical protein